MVETLKLLEQTDCTVCAVGTVQEEVGLRGAATAAFGVDPDLALALDVTIAGDVPGVREFDTSVKMGKGPALTISDSGLITHPKVLRWLIETAEEEKIPFQLESGLLGSTDAARISITRQGIPMRKHLHRHTVHPQPSRHAQPKRHRELGKINRCSNSKSNKILLIFHLAKLFFILPYFLFYSWS